MFTPAQLSPVPKHRKGDDFEYSFQFVEDDAPLNLSNFEDIKIRLYTGDTVIFEHSTTAEANLSSSDTVTDIVSGVVSGEVMDVGARRYYIDIETFLDGKKRTYVSSPFNVVGSGNSGTANEWLITITNSTDTATGERATNVMALAVKYKNEAETIRDETQTLKDSIEWKGEFDATTTYAKDNRVSYLGSSFISLQDGNTGNTPSDGSEFWDVIAEKGDKGEDGIQNIADAGDVNESEIIESLELDDTILIKNEGVHKPITYNSFLNQINLDQWFTMTIKTDNAGTSENNQFTIPTSGTGYNYTVLWGDGKSDTEVAGNITHTYDTAGVYTVRVRGEFPRIFFNGSGDKDKLIEINSWGDIEWQNFERAFSGCSNLVRSDSRYINTSNVTSMGVMFYNCSSLTSLDVSGWNTSKVTTMASMFRNCSSLTTLDVSGFDTSKVTTMASMFRNCSSLTTLDTSGWNTSKVTTMASMFRNCSSLTTLDVSGFDTSNVTNMERMFQNLEIMESIDVSGFDTGKVTNMSVMFYRCFVLSFNPSGFNVASVTNLSNFATDTNMGNTNYDALLVNWEAQLVNPNLSPNFGNAQYTAGSPAADARQRLIDNDGWSITDGGAI